MINSETYRIWFELKVIHPYYKATQLPMQVMPAPETAWIFRRYNLLFRQMDHRRWVVLVPGKAIEIDEVPRLTFALHPGSLLFYDVSSENLQANHSGFAIEECGPGEGWKLIHLPLEGMPEQITVTIPPKSVYWEYLLFPSGKELVYPVVVREKQNKLTFKAVEKVEWLDHSVVLRSCSATRIPLAGNSEYTVQLIEQRGGRERVVCEALPVPRPDSRSAMGDPETVTTYFYL